MRKVLIIGIIASTFCSYSCKKYYTCQCINIYSDHKTVSDTTLYDYKDTKAKAKKSCDSRNAGSSYSDVTTSCSIK
jgi:hypothetical protein